ncbi:MAG TPA: hypothetical protein VNG12_14475, partial [Acidimicrobiales bacterium]|nr:hypothetical protein [Acidimicrobiales bacterium]
MALGPFDVDEDQITRLGTGFTPFVSALIETEAARNRIDGSDFTFTTVEHIPDEGVDFEVRKAPATDWLPEGRSAWQFKRGDYEPVMAANEFGRATWAREIVSAGGSYVFVTGASLPPAAIGRRQKKIMAKAVELGLVAKEDSHRIRVYAANDLARWASTFPSLAVGALLGGPRVARDLPEWRESRDHKGITWVADDERKRQIAELRNEVLSTGLVTVRMEGPSGVGKTRMVMEALDTDECRKLVVYIPDERATIDGLIDHLHERHREAIVVVDECRGERHLKLVERFRSDPAIRLVTIGQGEATPTSTRTPIYRVARMPDETVEDFLKENFKTFGAEQRRFVVTNCAGNVRWAGAMAVQLQGVPAAQASEIIAGNDIERFVSEWLPEGRDFLYAASLALFERVGWDGDLRQQLRVVASFVGCTEAALNAVAVQLERRGLLVRQGRYRAIVPQPFAIYMATQSWNEYGGRIWSELLPDLDDEMMLSLLRRTADLGQFEPAQRGLLSLLSADGPFGRLDAIEEANSGRLLTQLAIVMPEKVMQHLGRLIDQSTIEDLLGYRLARRDLVWTLEKLVWHTRTFQRAADALLRLAVAEN